MRLIDADALIAMLEERACKPCKDGRHDYHGVRCRACQYGDEIDDIDNAPTVEAEPVKHGKWSYIFVLDGDYYRCTSCHYYTRTNSYFYCPYCGAKMDLESKTDEEVKTNEGVSQD